jgi:hypothetical protein
MDSTLAFALLAWADWKFTALGYPPQARSAAFISVFVLRHSHIFPGARLVALPSRPATTSVDNERQFGSMPLWGSDPGHSWIGAGGARFSVGWR